MYFLCNLYCKIFSVQMAKYGDRFVRLDRKFSHVSFIAIITLIDSYSVMKHCFNYWVTDKSHSRTMRARVVIRFPYGGERNLHVAVAELWERTLRTCRYHGEACGTCWARRGPRAAKRGTYNVLEYRKSLALQSYRARTRVICSWHSSNL